MRRFFLQYFEDSLRRAVPPHENRVRDQDSQYFEAHQRSCSILGLKSIVVVCLFLFFGDVFLLQFLGVKSRKGFQKARKEKGKREKGKRKEKRKVFFLFLSRPTSFSFRSLLRRRPSLLESAARQGSLQQRSL